MNRRRRRRQRQKRMRRQRISDAVTKKLTGGGLSGETLFWINPDGTKKLKRLKFRINKDKKVEFGFTGFQPNAIKT